MSPVAPPMLMRDLFGVVIMAVQSGKPDAILEWLFKAVVATPIHKHRALLTHVAGLVRAVILSGVGLQGLEGFVFRASGKISVTGNSMARIWWFRWGKIGISNMGNYAQYQSKSMFTDTGCLSVSICFFFK